MKLSIFIKALIAVAAVVLVSGCASQIQYTRVPGVGVPPSDIEPIQRQCRKHAMTNDALGKTESLFGGADKHLMAQLYTDCMAENGYKITCKRSGHKFPPHLCSDILLHHPVGFSDEIIVDGTDVTENKLK